MTQIYDLTGNTVKADAIEAPVTGGVTGAVTIGAVGGPTITAGAGAPSASAPKGSLYLNTTGSSTSTRLYVNNGTTNWIAITTAT
jgi:hypothetical protein